jgi:predicted ATP-grasp superfamily ATP-dependent carboligase
VSKFSSSAADAQETHDDWFGSDWEYRATTDDEFSAITARKYNERIENRKTEHGWKRIKMFDLSVTLAEIDQPILHSHVRQLDSEEIATVTEFVRITSDRWQLTCQNSKAGEISRPNLRRT